MTSRLFLNTRPVLTVVMLLTLTWAPQSLAYNKSWDQGHQCTQVGAADGSWGRYAYDAQSPADRKGAYTSKECCELLCKICPVYANTGRLQETFVDLQLPGLGPSLTITRTYASQDWATSLLGHGWTFNFGKKLTIIRSRAGDKHVAVRQETGELNFFKEGPGGALELLADYGVQHDLTRNSDGTYTIANRNGTRQHVSADGKMTSIVDKNGNVLSFEYSSVGCLDRITNASENYVDLQLGPNGKIVSISDNLRRTIGYTYDDNGNLTASTNPMGYSTRYVYDSRNRLTQIIDARGNSVLAVTYDTHQPPRVATLRLRK